MDRCRWVVAGRRLLALVSDVAHADFGDDGRPFGKETDYWFQAIELMMADRAIGKVVETKLEAHAEDAGDGSLHA